jgi:murein DD-endopeptidase MepM/ murein hydrolase activator NlpD
VVKKGDTLGGIAYAYGISVDGLQAANPSVLPAFLSIGTVLTIPVLAESAVSVGPAAVASPTPMPATVAVGPDCYHLTTGALYCLAEVRNPGPAPLYNVAAQIALIGPEGEVLASEVAFAALAMVRPGSGVPLAALFQGAPPGLAAPVAQVVSAEPVPAGVVAAVALDISAAQLVPPQVASPGALWTVSGQVHNGSAAAVGAVRLVVALYDAQKHLVGYRQVQIPGGLAAGVSQGFSISAASLGGPVESYAIAAEGKP